MKIEDVEGIGPTYAATLAAAGVPTTDALLQRGATPAGRADLAAATGISPKLVLEWVNHADLMRIDGVGSEYSDLLEAAGVDSPAELAQRNAANLAQTFQELDAARPNWIRQVPSVTTVEGWIAQAKTLPRVVTHGGAGGGNDGDGEPGPASEASADATSESAQPDSLAAPAGPATAGPVPAQPAAASARAQPAAPAQAPPDDGLMARIKRMFGR